MADEAKKPKTSKKKAAAHAGPKAETAPVKIADKPAVEKAEGEKPATTADKPLR